MHRCSALHVCLRWKGSSLALWYGCSNLCRMLSNRFHWIFPMCGAFSIACGSTHLVAVGTLWCPSYWFSGGVKIATASISLATAVLLIPLVPRALALPSPAELERVNRELHKNSRTAGGATPSRPGAGGGIFDRSPVIGEGDSRLVRTVIENLLGHGWKFTARETQARIECGAQQCPDGTRAFFVRERRRL
jgi:hypothetical protein